MAIDAPNELIIPAKSQIVYDKIGCLGMGLGSIDKEHSKFCFYYTLQYYRVLEDGAREWASTPQIDIYIEDLFALTDNNGDLSSLPDALLSAMVQIAQAQNKL